MTPSHSPHLTQFPRFTFNFPILMSAGFFLLTSLVGGWSWGEVTAPDEADLARCSAGNTPAARLTCIQELHTKNGHFITERQQEQKKIEGTLKGLETTLQQAAVHKPGFIARAFETHEHFAWQNDLDKKREAFETAEGALKTANEAITKKQTAIDNQLKFAHKLASDQSRDLKTYNDAVDKLEADFRSATILMDSTGDLTARTNVIGNKLNYIQSKIDNAVLGQYIEKRLSQVLASGAVCKFCKGETNPDALEKSIKEVFSQKTDSKDPASWTKPEKLKGLQ